MTVPTSSSHVPSWLESVELGDAGPRDRGLSWLMSAVLHLVLFLAVALLWHVEPRGMNAEPDRGGGIVLVPNAGEAPEYFSQADAAPATDAEATAAAGSTPSLPAMDSPPVDAAGALPSASAGQLLAGGAEALPSAASLTGDAGTSRPPGKFGDATQTYLFGVAGTGNKFVYVFDRSASMEGFQARPLAAAKRELIKSLQHLESTNQFQIIFYNDRTTVFNPHAPQRPRLYFGDDVHKQAAERFVRSIVADGSTRHFEAIKMALGMAPDVIFFLTDADEPQLTTAELDSITQLNERIGATIHAIQFGAGPNPGDNNFLVRLARRNHGSHVYVDVTELPRNP